MVVSLVNPHDVLFYPKTYDTAGYDDAWLQGEIEPPATRERGPVDEADRAGAVPADLQRLGADPHAADEAQLPELLRQPDEGPRTPTWSRSSTRSTTTGLLENTLVIATADHGEMGTSHGGMRQKNFNFYEESIRVPLVYSNPRLFPKPETNDALVSHVDFLPTLASLVGAPAGARDVLAGRRLLRPDPRAARPSRRRRTTPSSPTTTTSRARRAAPYPEPPNHIVSIRERRYKLARYYDVDGNVPDQWEMYDLEDGPARAHEPRLQGLQAHPRAASASTGGCGASSPGSSGRACSRSARWVIPRLHARG